MILSKRVALGGVQLDEIHERIVIRRIDPGVPYETTDTVDRMGGVGQRVTGQHWETLEVNVTYAIDVQKREMQLRREIFDAVNAWALKKGWLTVNWLPNRRFYVDKVVLPGSGDMWQWLNEYTITFRAYNIPFWQDELPAQAAGGIASSGRVWVPVGGNMKSVMDISFRNRSGMTINNFQVSAGGNTIRLSSLGLGGSSTLKISHGTDGLLRITADGVSVYSKYRGSDDLYVEPGNVAVDFAADRAGVLTAQCYGRWA